MTSNAPAHLADRFATNRQRIADSIRAGDAAREARDRARTPRSYDRATAALHRAQNAHTAAYAEFYALCAEWDAHSAATYGRAA